MGESMTLPILIIGAGPVGLALAVALQRQGIPCQVYEQLDDLSPEARASTFHPSTLEMFAEWGILDAVVARGFRVDSMQFWERDGHELLAQLEYCHIADDTPYPFRLQCPQSVVTRLLKPIIETAQPGTVHMGHTLTRFEDHGDHVTACFATIDGEVVVEGAYLCGADGSKSLVRKQLDLSFEGMTYQDRFLLVASDIDFKRIYQQFGAVSYIFDPDEWVIVLQLPDMTRTVFQVHPHEQDADILQPAAVYERFAKFAGTEVIPQLHGISIYSVHQRVAETFRVGRVLLLGDAAHINNPMGGMGMNSGIHDAHCLSGYLTQVMNGGHDSLLDDYSARRRGYALA
ncbi:MAG TPA: FAD-dependent monooxygenase, partial [Phototrophicaceae bacterium]|nr:FAD-dependent monooxygenase [Phototrophicaceae bacterium]